jgi:glycosyltransferase involved in cell wall biosynthesis
MDPLVSILIPAYNAEKWIEETLLSAVNQTWEHKEIIVVDDGSKDYTMRIAKKYESKSVKVITQENRGAAAARNKALSIAQGSYIQWLDADDLLEPSKITKQLTHADNGIHKRILLSSSFGTFFYSIQRARFSPNALWQDLSPKEWIVNKFSENAFMCPTTWLVSRELTERAGPWDERLSLDDDGEYFCRVVACSEMVKFISQAKSYYRRLNFGSISRLTSYEACGSLLLSLSLCCNHLRSLEDTARTRIACLNLLQTWYGYFYPEKRELLAHIHALARELGGGLVAPKVSWKYSLIFKVLGWTEANKIVASYRNTKIRVQQNWDRLYFYTTQEGSTQKRGTG